MKAVHIALLITGICEAVLGIPVLGGLIVFSTSWSILFIMFLAHIATLVICIVNKRPSYPSIIGSVASVLGWIPFLGMALHILSAVFLIRGAVLTKKVTVSA